MKKPIVSVSQLLQYIFVYSVCFLPALIFIWVNNNVVIYFIGVLSGIWSVYWYKFAFSK